MSPLLRRRAKPGGPPAPFVVASPRSGTTLLRMMLDAHPQLAVPFETHFVPELIAAVEAGGGPDAALEVMTGHRRWGDFYLEAGALGERLRSHDTLTPGDAVRSFYSLYAESQGKSRWGDKTPEYVEFMRPIAGAVGEARFVHVIRDGRDVALSRIRWRQERSGKTPKVRRLARRWKEAITVAREQARKIDQYLEVRYEDLVAEPGSTLQRICEFIELEYDPAMLAYHEGAAERMAEIDRTLPGTSDRLELDASQRLAKHEMATKPPERDRIFAWRNDMSDEDRREFEQVAGELLSELGYPVGDDAVAAASAIAEGGADPDPLGRKAEKVSGSD
ncbi:MAG: sulfotransferase family protein [Solirubrobacterales bacterium]